VYETAVSREVTRLFVAGACGNEARVECQAQLELEFPERYLKAINLQPSD
jgi:hypothetical protein